MRADAPHRGLRLGVARATAAVAAGALALAVGCATYEIAGPEEIIALRITGDTLGVPMRDSLRVRASVIDATGAALVNETIEWSSLAPTVVTVDGEGWVRPVAPGSARVVAAKDAFADTATILVSDVPATAEVAAGNSQTAAVGTAVANDPAVRVRGVAGALLEGVPVTFTVTAGGGSIVGATTVSTDAAGVARIDEWRMGDTPGANTLTATVAGSGVTGNPVLFTATAVAGPASASRSGVTVAPATISASAGTQQAVVTVTVRDALGNLVPGAAVTLAATGSGNTVTQPTAVTDAQGRTTGRLHSTAIGAKVVTATVGGTLALDSTVTVTVTPGAPSVVTRQAGEGQSAAVNAAVATLPRVRVVDAFGTAVPGVNVTFAVGSGGGTVTAPAAVTTDAQGEAVPGGWVLGPAAGANTLVATVAGAGITGNPITFNATATVGPPSAATSGVALAPTTITQSTGASFSDVTVTVRDANGSTVMGATVTLAASGAGNTITQPTATTDAFGRATGRLSSSIAGGKVVTATVGGTTAIDSTPTLTVQPLPPTSVTRTSADAQTHPVNVAVASPPSVRVLGAGGLPVQGATVTFAVTAGGGTITGPAVLQTNVTGDATLGGWTLGPAAGANTLVATVTGAGISGNPVTFNATATVGAPSASRSGLTIAPATIAQSDGSLFSIVTVTVRDANGSTVMGANVALAATGTGNIVTQPAGTTDALGQVTGRVASSVSGAKVVSAVVNSSITLDTTRTLTVNSVSPEAVNRVSTDNQTGPPGSTVASVPTVRVTGAGGLPVGGVQVTFAVTGGGGSVIAPATVVTDEAGDARPGGWTLGTGVGVNTLSATVSGTGISGNPVTFTATVVVGPPNQARIGVVASPTTISASNGSSSSVITVRVRDADGFGVPGATVVLSATGTGNTITQPAVTNASGVATGSISSTVPGAKVVSAFVGGSVTADSTATVTVNPGPAASVSAIAGDGQSATTGTAVATLPAVRVLDAVGNAVPNATVTFAIGSGGGSVTAPTVVLTDALGEARPGGWTLGVTSGTKTLTATVTGAGISGNPVTFTATAVSAALSLTRSGISASPASIVASAGGTTSTISVRVRDVNGNPISGRTVTLSATGTGNTIVQPAVTDANGLTSGTISSTVAAAKTISATIGGTGGGLVDSTTSVTVTFAGQSQLAMITQPAGARSGSAFTTQPVVEIRDAFGNRVTNSTSTITASVFSGDGVLINASVAASAGRATFTALTVRGPLGPTGDTLGVGNHTIRFSGTSLTAVDAAVLNVAPSFSYNVQFMLRNTMSGGGSRCTLCHGDAFASYTSLVSVASTGCGAGMNRITPNSLANSRVYQLVLGASGSCTQMPSAALPWSTRLRGILSTWITNGAPNN